MTRTRIAGVLVLTMCVASLAHAQEQRPAARPAIAVVAFDTSRTGWMPPPGFGDTVAELLTDRLIAGGAFRIIDGSLVAVPGDEPGRTPVTVLMERAAGAGVRFLVVGAVTRLSMEQRTSTGGGLLPIPIIGGLIRKQKTDSIIGLTLRMIDVRTGEVVTTATAHGNASGNNSSGGGVGGFIQVPFAAGKSTSARGIQDGLLANAVANAVVSAAEQLSAVGPRLGRPEGAAQSDVVTNPARPSSNGADASWIPRCVAGCGGDDHPPGSPAAPAPAAPADSGRTGAAQRAPAA